MALIFSKFVSIMLFLHGIITIINCDQNQYTKEAITLIRKNEEDKGNINIGIEQNGKTETLNKTKTNNLNQSTDSQRIGLSFYTYS